MGWGGLWELQRQTCPLSFTGPPVSFTLSCCSSPSCPFLILGECGSSPSLKSALLFLFFFKFFFFLMMTIFKDFIKFVTILFLFYVLFFCP